jgi:hypothetical protein
MHIDRDGCRQIHQVMESQVFPLIEKLTDLKPEGGRMTFSPGHNLSFKLTLSQKDTAGVASNPEVEEFKVFCTSFGLKPTDLHRVFRIRGEDYQLLGLRRRRHRFPFSVKRVSDGKRFKFAADSVVYALGHSGTLHSAD